MSNDVPVLVRGGDPEPIGYQAEQPLMDPIDELSDPMDMIQHLASRYPGHGSGVTQHSKEKLDGIFRSKESRTERLFGSTVDWHVDYLPKEYRSRIREKYIGLMAQVSASDAEATASILKDLRTEVRQIRQLCMRNGMEVPDPLSIPGQLPPPGLIDPMEMDDAFRSAKANTHSDSPGTASTDS